MIGDMVVDNCHTEPPFVLTGIAKLDLITLLILVLQRE